jgi:nucleoid DNA-binding protein
MKKADLINSIAQRSSLTKKDSAAALEATLTAITCALSNGEPVTLVGFGTFAVSERAAREGINPQTKAAIKIEAAKVPKFRPGKALRDAIN